jgi:hypothetical protein
VTPRPLIVAAVLLGLALRVLNLGNVGQRTPDEQVYASQAQVLLHEGVAGNRRLAAEYVRDTARLYPPPSRPGYVALVAGVMATTGTTDERAGAWLSCAASAAALTIAALIAARFFHPWIAVMATVMLAVFPPDLVLARRAWQESVVNCAAWLLLYWALALGSGGARRWPAAALVGGGSAFLLVKETAVAVYALCLGWVALRLRWGSLRIGLAAVAGALLSTALLAWTLGGMSVLWDIRSGLRAANAANPYALEYATGPGYLLLSALWTTSPLTTGLATLGLVAVWRAPLRDRSAALAVAAFGLALLTLLMILPHFLNLRYASIAFAPLCILAATAVWWVLERTRTWLGEPDGLALRVLVCVGLVLAGVADYQRFRDQYVKAQTADLSVRMVLEAARR